MDKQRLTDAVIRYQGGDNAAFNIIYEETCNNLNIYARSLEKDPQQAEDLLQNTYMQVVRGIGNLQDPGAFLTWSKRIMHHQYVDEIRGSHGENVVASEEALLMFDEVIEEDRDMLPEESFDAKEIGRIVWGEMDQMPPAQKVVMLAFYRDEMSVTEIADMMGLPENTVKTRLFYGRRSMKARIEDYEQKHDIRLHSLIPGPIISMALRYQVPAELTMSAGQSASLLGRITESAGQTAQTASGAASSTGSSASGTAASSSAASSGAAAAAGIGGGKIVAIVIAGVLVIGAAGFGIHHAVTGNDTAGDSSTDQAQTEIEEEMTQSGVLSDEDYPEMISGGLSKEEVSAALAWTTAWMGDSYADPYDADSGTGVDYATYRDRVASEMDFLVLFTAVEYDLDRDYYRDPKIPLDEVNRFRAFWGMEQFEPNVTYDEYFYTDEDYLHFTSGWGDGPVIEAMELTSAEYDGDEMEIRFTLSWSDPIFGNGADGPFVATLKQGADGAYALISIEKDGE